MLSGQAANAIRSTATTRVQHAPCSAVARGRRAAAGDAGVGLRRLTPGGQRIDGSRRWTPVEMGEKAMQSLRLFAAALIAIAVPAFGLVRPGWPSHTCFAVRVRSKRPCQKPKTLKSAPAST